MAAELYILTWGWVMVKDKRIVDFLSVTVTGSFTNMDLASSLISRMGLLRGCEENFCLTVVLPVTLFLSPWKQPLKVWCTLRNKLRQNILTSHWRILLEYLMWVKERINCFSSLSFIQSKVRSDSKWLNYTRCMRICIQTPVSYVRLQVCLSSFKFYIAIPCYSVWASMLVVPTVVCVLSIYVCRNLKTLTVIAYCKLLVLWDGVRAQQRERKPDYNCTALVERSGVVWVSLRA